MKICLDNIIFSLQNTGGISVVWYEHLKRLLNDPEMDAVFIDELNQNLFRKKLVIPLESIIKNPLGQYPVFIQRYLNPNAIQAEGIFHSSYYRTIENSKMVNVTTVHDFTYEHFRKGIPRIIHHEQKAKAIRHSDRIICVSNNTKEDLLRFFPEIFSGKVNVIYNGVDDNYKSLKGSNKDQLWQMITFPSGHYAVYVGDRRSIYKNFKIAVLGCTKAHIPLVVVGGGTLTQVERSFLDNTLTVSNYAKLDNLSNQQLNLVYNHALCLLYPSSYEGFGLPIIEAQKAGCIVVCQPISSIPEIAGEGAFFLENESSACIADTLKQISTSPSYVSTIIEKGLKNALRFSWDKCYEQTKQVYRSVL